MNRRNAGLALLGLLAAGAAPRSVEAQQAGKVYRIGILSVRPPGPHPMTDALMQGLRDLGYVDGRNLAIEYPDARGREDRLPELAAELVRSRVDVILVLGPAPLGAARRATKTIPLVMIASSSDPVAEGVAQSLARPGGNITGLTYAVSSERFGKQLELLKSADGRVTRVAVLWDFDLEIFRRFWAAPLADAGRILGTEVQDPVLVRDAHCCPRRSPR